MEGSSLRELMTYGLRLVLQAPPAPTQPQRAAFPLIHAGAAAAPLADAETAAALAEMDEEETRRYADSLRR